jgi:hypothetical protein
VVCTYLKKRNKPDVPAMVIQDDVRAAHERRLSLRLSRALATLVAQLFCCNLTYSRGNGTH